MKSKQKHDNDKALKYCLCAGGVYRRKNHGGMAGGREQPRKWGLAGVRGAPGGAGQAGEKQKGHAKDGATPFLFVEKIFPKRKAKKKESKGKQKKSKFRRGQMQACLVSRGAGVERVSHERHARGVGREARRKKRR